MYSEIQIEHFGTTVPVYFFMYLDAKYPSQDLEIAKAWSNYKPSFGQKATSEILTDCPS